MLQFLQTLCKTRGQNPSFIHRTNRTGAETQLPTPSDDRQATPNVTVEQKMENKGDGSFTEQLQLDQQSKPKSTRTRNITSRFKDFMMH